ncbi:MAG: hypothetical protein ACJ72H_18945 [Candidatus Sulfotelmatobacter sp.]
MPVRKRSNVRLSKTRVKRPESICVWRPPAHGPGGVGVFLRALPEKLWYWVVAQSTMTITVKDDDDAFVWVKEWFLEQKFLKPIRRVDLDTTLRGAELALIPAPGRHWFVRAGRPFWVWFYRSEDTKGRSQRRIESLTFQTIGRDQSFLKQFVDEVVACHHRKRRTASYLYQYDEGWDYVEAYSPRLLESVLLKPGEKERLIQDLERFRASRASVSTAGSALSPWVSPPRSSWNGQDISRLSHRGEVRHVSLRRQPDRAQ